MALANSKVTAQGRISVPLEVRRRLGIGPGSVLGGMNTANTSLFAGPVGTSGFAQGGLPGRAAAARTVAEMKEGIRLRMKNGVRAVGQPAWCGITRDDSRQVAAAEAFAGRRLGISSGLG